MIEETDIAPIQERSADDPAEKKTCISQTKRWRMTLDKVLQEMKHESMLMPNQYLEESRAREQAVVHLSGSIMWCGMIMKALDMQKPGVAPNPYPESYNPASQVVAPTADGLKL